MLRSYVHWQHNAEHKCSELANYFVENPDFLYMNFEIKTTMDALLNKLPSNLPLIAIIEAERAHIVIEKTPDAEYAEYDFLNLVIKSPVMSTLPATFIKDFHDTELCKRMEYHNLARTGLQVSKVSLGTATLSDLFGDLDVDEAIKMVHKAIKSGINYIDTAPYYGQGRSEEVLGMALKDIPREAYYIATKVARYEKDLVKRFDFSAERTRESVEKSLKLLGLDYVDVIQIHDVDMAKDLDIIINETLPELEKIVKEGKAKFIGITGYTLDVLKECLLRAPGRIDTILSYSRHTLLDNSLKSYVDFFQEQDVGIVCASAHALGLLTSAGPQSWHPAGEDLKALCKKAANICKERNIELGKLAMYEFMQLDGASTFLVGMETRKLLDINLSAYYNGLSKKEKEVLKLLKETIFTKTYNWDGIELEEYKSAVAKAKGKKE